jgi:hypothetical protein
MGNTTILRGDQIEGIESSQNFIKNLGERNTAGWVRYNDGGSNPSRPIDGIGGTPTSGLDVTLSATNPLAGDKSFVFSKPASNCQGQGFSYDFAIDRASRAKVLKIEFDYLVDSGTFNAGSNTADSDLIVYLYDVDASQLIEPSTFKLYSNASNIADKFSGYFQTSATSTNYRLIFHVATTNASAWSLKVDNVVVAPSKYVYGTPITDWTQYTPTFNSGFSVGTGGNPFNKWYWRQVGDSVQIRGGFRLGTSGFSMGSGAFTVTLPSGLSFDYSKLTFNYDRIGVFHSYDNYGAGHREVGVVIAAGGSSNTFFFSLRRDDGTQGDVSATFPFTWGADDEFCCTLEAPIQGWSSSVRMSDGYEGRIVAGRFFKTNSQTIPNVTTTDLTGFSVDYDTCSAFNVSTGVYTVLVSGYYHIAASITFDANGSGERIVHYKTNGNYFRLNARRNDGAGYWTTVVGSTTIYCTAGQTIQIAARHDSGAPLDVLFTSADRQTVWTIERISSPQTIAMGEVVAARYTSSSGQSIPQVVGTIVNFNTKEYDTHNAVTTGTNWKFTAPVAGTYNVSSYLLYDTFPISGIGDMVLSVNKNDSTYAEIGRTLLWSGAQFYVPVGGTTDIQLNAGDTISIKAENYSGAARTLVTSGVYVWVAIHKIS